jgi:hypothetical protein
MNELTPTATYSNYFALTMGVAFLAVGVMLSFRRGRPHPLLLVSFSAVSFSWLEAPYDWAVYAQFPPALPRMPSWWPLNWTYGGGVPQSVPIGYVSYFVIPSVVSVGLARGLSKTFRFRRPLTLLTVGLVVGSLYALSFNGFIGAKLGVFHYGRVIEGLAIRPGSVQQYPLYDALAMGVQVMVFTYLLGRTDTLGRTIIDAWADSKMNTRLGSSLLAIVGFAVIGNLVYLSVFAPHYVTKLLYLQTVAPSEQLYPGIPNQPL